MTNPLEELAKWHGREVAFAKLDGRWEAAKRHTDAAQTIRDAMREIERRGERVAKLEAFVFDLVSGATGDLSAAELAAACALTMPKAEEIAAAAQEWFDRAITPTNTGGRS